MRLLDLFCGAGGAAMGYSQAGFTEIVGVDIEPQPNYPFTFIPVSAGGDVKGAHIEYLVALKVKPTADSLGSKICLSPVIQRFV